MDTKLTSASSVTSERSRTAAARQRRSAKKHKKRLGRTLFRLFLLLVLLAVSAVGWLFLTPSGTNIRYLAADTLITTQHRYLAKYIIGQAELNRRVAEYQKQFDDMGVEKDRHQITLPPPAVEEAKPLVQVEDISGAGYKGFLMIVNDPTKIRLGVPAVPGKGERVLSMVQRYGAIAGVNAGGFADPNWEGNGFQPIGVVISQGKVFYDDTGKSKTTQIVGIDKNGKMIAGRYTLKQMQDMGVQEAVTFQPRIIVNGKGLIKNAKDGWGIAPRTAMGQRADGAILFVVIDGRQPGRSIGANLYDVQQIMLKHGAVIAANLDGGSSTMLVKDGKVLNKPSTKSPEGRYLPTAWLVFEHPEEAHIANVWAGLRPQDIDPAKW
ncbi:phosphodiester glycosidase family protein [Paenibacillus humicola]|uniref:phosphodiester glycosidase family protein n=1 Tax=Paenibacillus humicola TaxID=3110540 RepID=UPI00237BEACC|nr:phosphodiester glycosidase family protein [Paenibacillus humicola]